MPPKQTDPQFKLRMTPEIKDAIETAAARNNRSMNAEILARLQASIDGTAEGMPSTDLLADLREERGRLERLLAEYVFLFRADVGGSPEELRKQFDEIQRSRERERPRAADRVAKEGRD
ncbi:Arc family DNA-binding protein [Rhizobium sp. S-51]|uniref:Arc family DNA-binding protein n=1 Tax=Rhizobium terricola TaxID=2728849 RepID=A0A7Y0AXG1_9HYPH|nr:Arc family DNA-binding protein [Rhizobium terricola]NML75274.1 Arc family DNA-binding protein [Rhizobium terricola]